MRQRTVRANGTDSSPTLEPAPERRLSVSSVTFATEVANFRLLVRTVEHGVVDAPMTTVGITKAAIVSGQGVVDALTTLVTANATGPAVGMPKTTTVVIVKVHAPVVVTVNVLPAVVTQVGTVTQEVVKTTAVLVNATEVHVSTVTHAVSTVNVWLYEYIVVGTLVHVAVKT